MEWSIRFVLFFLISFQACVHGQTISGGGRYEKIVLWDTVADEEIEQLKNLILPQEEIDRIRPKLDCHPSYNTDASDWERGEGKRIFIYKFCKYGEGKDESCVAECMYEQLGIVQPSQHSFSLAVWNDLDSFISQLRNFLIDADYVAATSIAEQVFDACRHEVLQEPAPRSPCNTQGWFDFSQCVDPVIDCDKKVE